MLKVDEGRMMDLQMLRRLKYECPSNDPEAKILALILEIPSRYLDFKSHFCDRNWGAEPEAGENSSYLNAVPLHDPCRQGVPKATLATLGDCA